MKVRGFFVIIILLVFSCTEKNSGKTMPPAAPKNMENPKIQVPQPPVLRDETQENKHLFVENFNQPNDSWHLVDGSFNWGKQGLTASKSNSIQNLAISNQECRIQIKASRERSKKWGIKLISPQGELSLKISPMELQISTENQVFPTVSIGQTISDESILSIYAYQELVDIFWEDQLILTLSGTRSITEVSLIAYDSGIRFRQFSLLEFKNTDPTITFNMPPNQKGEIEIKAYRLYANGRYTPISEHKGMDFVGFYLYPGYAYVFESAPDSQWLYIPSLDKNNFTLKDNHYQISHLVKAAKIETEDLYKHLENAAPFNTEDPQDPNYLEYLQLLSTYFKEIAKYKKLFNYQAGFEQLAVEQLWPVQKKVKIPEEQIQLWLNQSFKKVVENIKSTILTQILRNRIREKLEVSQPNQELEGILLKQMEEAAFDLDRTQNRFESALLDHLKSYMNLPGSARELPPYEAIIEQEDYIKEIIKEVWDKSGFRSLVDASILEILNLMGDLESPLSLDQAIVIYQNKQSPSKEVKISRNIQLYLQSYEELISRLESILNNPHLSKEQVKVQTAHILDQLEKQEYQGDVLIEEKRLYFPAEFKLIEQKLDPMNQKYGKLLQQLNSLNIWNENITNLESDIQTLMDPEAKSFLLDFYNFIEKYKGLKEGTALSEENHSLKDMEDQFAIYQDRDNEILLRLYENSHPDYFVYNEIAQVLRDNFLEIMSQ